MDKIKAELTEILEEYQKKLSGVKNKTPEDFPLATDDIVSKPDQIIIDLANKMDYAKGLYIFEHGDENEPIIDEIISTSLQSFVEKWNAIRQ